MKEWLECLNWVPTIGQREYHNFARTHFYNLGAKLRTRSWMGSSDPSTEWKYYTLENINGDIAFFRAVVGGSAVLGVL
jgi:hypothetical protein